MSLREQILELMQQADFRPTDEAGLLRRLGLNKKQKSTLVHELRLLLSHGDLVRVQGDRFRWAGKTGELTGTLLVKGSGRASVRLTPGQEEADLGDISIENDYTANALHGDKVAVRVSAARRFNRRQGGKQEGSRQGRIVRVIERARETVVGTLIKGGRLARLQPDDPRLPQILLPGPGKEEAATGDKIVVKLQVWDDLDSPPSGTLERRLGKQWEPRAELLGVYEKFKLETTFPPAVVKQAEALPPKVRNADLADRLDFREVPTLTIDPADAKDFDDALSLEPQEDGSLRVGIHIADVSHYVKQGEALDTEARKRGNSTYLVGTVVPMLPERLSNGLCSLVEGEDRLTLATFITFDKASRPIKFEYGRAVIRSRKRLSYEQAQALLKLNDFDAIRALPGLPAHQTGATGRPLSSLSDLELIDLQSWIRKLWVIAKRLRDTRMKKGSLDLDMPETKIYVDKEGYAERLVKMVHNESHQLIEEFMLAANEAVARLTRSKKLHSVYRVHDEPDFKKLAEYREFAETLGVKCGELTRHAEVIKLLEIAENHPQGHLLKSMFLRSLKKACYRATPDGHYGLCKKDYTHFTSPIRRYADLVVHRVLIHSLEGGAGAAGKKAPAVRGDLNDLAQHISETETNSQEAERESQKIKMLEFFERELKKTPKTRFEAIITEVRGNGLFIELVESMAFGFIPIAALGEDRFEQARNNRAREGKRKDNKYELGATLPVVVAAVDRQRRMINFEPAQEETRSLFKPKKKPLGK